jgi:hypothetical protein
VEDEEAKAANDNDEWAKEEEDIQEGTEHNVYPLDTRLSH